MMINLSPANRFFKYIQDAAKLKLEIVCAEKDQAFINSGGTIHYATDTNIVKLYMNPNDVGATRGKRTGYGVVFFDDPDDSAISIASALSQYIFFELTSHAPLLLLQGHDAETRGIYERVTAQSSNLEETAKKELDEKRSKILESLGSLSPTDINSATNEFKSLAPSVYEYLYDESGPRHEWLRIGELLRSNRISRLESFPTMAWSNNPTEAKALAECVTTLHNGKGQWRSLYLAAIWRGLIEKEKSAARQEHRIRSDYTALAMLQHLNEKLEKLNHRVVLITGDSSIHRAASNQLLGENSETFADRYIRSPRAFITSPSVILPREEFTSPRNIKPNFVEGWLDSLLARFGNDVSSDISSMRSIIADEKSISCEEIRKRISQILDSDPNAVSKIQETWTAHTRNTIERHSASSQLSLRSLKAVLGGAIESETSNILSKIDEILKKETDKSWDIFFDTLVETGFELITLPENDWLRTRYPPPINFESFTNTKQFIRKLVDLKPADKSGIGLDEDLKKIDSEDQTGYSKTLAYAFLFADRNRWHVADQLASRAIDIARRIGIKDNSSENDRAYEESNITGREAYYFKSISTRILARRSSDLHKAKEAIINATAAWEMDISKRPNLGIKRTKFDAEICAIKVQNFLFEKSENPNLETPKEGKKLKIMFSCLSEVWDEIDSDGDPWVTLITKRNVLTNIFMVLALIEKSDFEIPIEPAEIEEFRRHFKNNYSKQKMSDGTLLPITFLVESVFIYAQSADKGLTYIEQANLLNQIKIVKRKLALSTHKVSVSPYDRWRYKLLFDLAEKNIVAA